ncbi:MAG: hypothetical protein LBF51_04570 [Zoogloeaceae bacterium]|jgi:hypothetical protein|nr:hypothetical protein [Zoogloeaceae bacterium]
MTDNDNPPLRIYAADLAEFRARHQRYCARGCREWAQAHGLDWAEFVRNGVTAEQLLATGDALAKALVDWCSGGAGVRQIPSVEDDTEERIDGQ